MDVIVRSHAVSSTSRPAPGFGTCCLNIDGVKYTFSGAPSHQMTPWAGRNALEAVIHLFNNIDSVRSSIRPEARDQLARPVTRSPELVLQRNRRTTGKDGPPSSGHSNCIFF
jgi:metal-dependent amidase/aminoacylase/carboxypeptidase family protein